jgi:hypothetical protein
MAGHRVDRRRLKMHRSYTVDQAARTVGTTRATVRRWLKNGLHAIDQQKPAIMRGKDIIEFLARRARPRQKCPLGQCFCVKCRAPRPPDGGMAEFVVLTPTGGNLRALCPVCGTMMHRRTSQAQLDQLKPVLEISIAQRPRRLSE